MFLTLLGLSEVIGGFIAGIAMDQASIKFANILNILFTIIALGLLIIFVYKE